MGDRVTTLQWAVGGFCALLGALMVVAPHQFSGPLFSAMSGYLYWVGYLFLLAGVALVGGPVLGASRSWVILSHVVAAAALLALVYNNLLLGFPGAVDLYAVLALGTILAPFVTGFRGLDGGLGRSGSHGARDYFALVFGAVCASYGALRLLLPDHFSAPTVNPTWPYLWLYSSRFLVAHIWLFGAAFLAAGAALIAAQALPTLQGALRRAAHLLILLPCLSYALLASIPLLAWTGILLYVGFSLTAASLPWTGPLLRRLNPRSFSFRLALALAPAAALPLIVVVGIVTSEQEGQARTEAEGWLQTSAVVVASDVSHYVGSYQSEAIGLASHPGLLAMSPADQRALLRSAEAAFPDAIFYATFDGAGNPIARSDDKPLIPITGMEPFETVRRTNAPYLYPRVSVTYGVPIFGIGEPIHGADGGFAGMVAVGLDSSRVATILNQETPAPGSRVYLVDAAGRVLAHPDPKLVSSFADLSATPPVAKLLASPAERGVVSSTGPSGDLLAAYARVSNQGWTVVVDQPAGSALAADRSAQDVAFGLLLGAIALAVVAASLISRSMARPLAALSRASRGLARGDDTVALPRGGTSEIQNLSSTFGLMRTQLVAREAERERLLAELEATLEAAPAAVVSYDLSGRIARLNAAAKQILGLSSADQALSMAELVEKLRFESADGTPVSLEDFPPARALRGERVGGVEMSLHPCGLEGDWKAWVLDGAGPIRARDGSVLGAVVSYVDVTELRDLQERQRHFLVQLEARATELAFERDRLHTILEGITDAIFVCDKQGVITLANSAARALIGEDVVDDGRTLAGHLDALKLRDRHSGQPVSLEDLAITRALHGEVVLGKEELATHPRSGKHVDLLVSASPLGDASGQIVGAVEVAKDVSALSTLEHEKDEFIAVAAHELKTPVAIMKGYAQALLRRSPDLDQPRRKMLESVDRGCNRIDRIVEDLLDISRLHAGQLELSLDRLDLSGLVAEVVERTALMTSKHQLRVTRAQPVIIWGDRDRLEQVLAVLVDNAVRYSPRGGDVEVAVVVGSNEVVVEIRDQGVGIPVDKQARLFERFYRAHTGTPYDYGGMGVGLYISKEIVVRHGGRIWAESEVGEGSTFSFALPLDRP